MTLVPCASDRSRFSREVVGLAGGRAVTLHVTGPVGLGWACWLGWLGLLCWMGWAPGWAGRWLSWLAAGWAVAGLRAGLRAGVWAGTGSWSGCAFGHLVGPVLELGW